MSATEHIFGAGTVFREGGNQYAVVDQGPRNRVVRNLATNEVTSRSVASLRAGYTAGMIVFDDLFANAATTDTYPDLDRSLTDFGQRALNEVKVKRYYLDGVSPQGRILYPRAELATKLEAMHRELPTKLPSVTAPARPPSVSTFYQWRQQWLRSHFSNKRLVNRYDLRGRRPEPISEEMQPLLENVIEEFYSTGNRPSLSATLQIAQAEVIRRNIVRSPGNQLPMPTLGQVKRVLATGDRFQQLRERYGVAFATRATKVFGRKPDVDHLLERVEMDHTPLDVICFSEDGGLMRDRPHLTVLIDVCSRMVLAAWISFRSPNAATVLRALKQAILPKDELLKKYGIKGQWPARGVMRELVLDNGKDFHSSAVEAAALDLGIQLVYCPPRQPRFKGVIERYLKEVNYSFVHLLPGTTFAKYHLREDYDSVKSAALPIEDLRRFVYRWIVQVYHNTLHRGLMKCPLQKWQEHDGPIDRPTLPRRSDVLDVYLTLSEKRRLSSKGIEVSSLFYTSPELSSLRLRLGNVELEIRKNPDDLGHIHVFHPETKTYFRANCTSPDYANGISDEQHTYTRERARKDYAALPHYNAMLAAKQDLIEEARRIRVAHKSKQAKPSGAGGNKQRGLNRPVKPQSGRSGIEMQCRAEMAAAVQHPAPEPTSVEEAPVSFDDIDLLDVGQTELF